jgi:ribosomal-protein-alanine N-acetyltransferase
MDFQNFIEGENIYLRALYDNDANGSYSGWLNDPEITAFNSHGRFPMTKEKLSSYIDHSRSSKNDLILAVVDKTSLKHIGNISLQNISWLDRNAEIAFLLGDKAFWGKGVMYEAGKLLINHGFKTLNLHRIYCGTSSENLGMQKLAEKLNMKKEGLRKEAIFNRGQYFDIVEYGILSTEI